ncbi:hypothetical protein ACFL2D_02755 [Patescibacteria group bacterium]
MIGIFVVSAESEKAPKIDDFQTTEDWMQVDLRRGLTPDAEEQALELGTKIGRFMPNYIVMSPAWRIEQTLQLAFEFVTITKRTKTLLYYPRAVQGTFFARLAQTIQPKTYQAMVKADPTHTLAQTYCAEIVRDIMPEIRTQTGSSFVFGGHRILTQGIALALLDASRPSLADPTEFRESRKETYEKLWSLEMTSPCSAFSLDFPSGMLEVIH